MPVLILGCCLRRKSYEVKDYVVSLVVVSGCAWFLLTDTDAAVAHSHDTLFGIALVVTYLSIDGFTTTLQERLFSGYEMHPMNQMFYVSLGSFLLISLELVSSGAIWECFGFVMRHPYFLFDSFALAMSSTLGTIAIYYTVHEFGALFFALVMTTRQIISILLSCIIYSHPLGFSQWVAVVIVFASIYVSKLPPPKIIVDWLSPLWSSLQAYP